MTNEMAECTVTCFQHANVDETNGIREFWNTVISHVNLNILRIFNSIKLKCFNKM